MRTAASPYGQQFFSNPTMVLALAALCCVLWGSSFPAIKTGYEMLGVARHDVPSKLIFAGYRFLLAGLCLLALAACMRKPVLRLDRKQFGQVAVPGVAQTGLQYVFFYIGLAYTSGVRASILNVSKNMDAMVMTGWQLAIGGLALLAGGYLAGGNLGTMTPASTALLVYPALLSAVAFTVWRLLLKYNPVGKISVFAFLVPVFGSALSALFLNDTILEWKNLAALLLVCGGIWLVTRTQAQPVSASAARQD